MHIYERARRRGAGRSSAAEGISDGPQKGGAGGRGREIRRSKTFAVARSRIHLVDRRRNERSQRGDRTRRDRTNGKSLAGSSAAPPGPSLSRRAARCGSLPRRFSIPVAPPHWRNIAVLRSIVPLARIITRGSKVSVGAIERGPDQEIRPRAMRQRNRRSSAVLRVV